MPEANKQNVHILAGTIVAAVTLLGAGSAQAGLVFNFNSTGNAQADALFAMAGSRYSNLFTDNVTLNIGIQFTAMAPGVLGSASTTRYDYSYSDVRAAMVGDAKSADDATATDHLQTGPAIKTMTHLTADSPFGAGSPELYLDENGSANNSNIRLTSANAKALGLLSDSSSLLDGSITFSNLSNWDLNPLDGITTGALSFLATAMHEIGHILGFTSGVDGLDASPGQLEDAYRLTTLDLFRYSDDTYNLGATDFTADTYPKYFSIDGGATVLDQFSTGRYQGDGKQASHWKDDWACSAVCGVVRPYIGLMDPTGSYGPTVDGITMRDLQAFDVIGWDLRSEIPEPGTFALLALGLAGITAMRKRR